jgi:peptidoglycan/LPS O-acetylase OafA/YrhL
VHPVAADRSPAKLAPPRLGRQPAFDGARGVAWSVVFVAHANLVPDAAVGQVAMFFFFTLSGFLITALLVDERQRTGSVSLRRFFARRALRLLPALYLFLAVWMAVVLVFPHATWLTTVPGGGSGVEPWTVAVEGIGAAVGYLSNWANIFGLSSGYFPLGHLWSLAVEEQFYLVWAPLLAFVLARRWRAPEWAAAFLAVASLVDVALLHGRAADSLWVDMGTDTRAGAFLGGAAAALAWHHRRTVVAFLQGRARTVALTLSIVVFGWAAVVLKQPPSNAQFLLAFSAVTIVSPVLVLAIMGTGPGVRRLLSHPVLVYVGQRSYALYLWHYVWLTWLRSLGFPGVVGALAATLVCGELSWRLVEARALAHKARFATPAPVASAASVSTSAPERELTTTAAS